MSKQNPFTANSIEHCSNIASGLYYGRWGGSTVVIDINGEKSAPIKLDVGLRGFNIPCSILVNDFGYMLVTVVEECEMPGWDGKNKPVFQGRMEYGEDSYRVFHCPKCKDRFDDKYNTPNYCKMCGIEFNWRSNEDNSKGN